MKIIVLTGGGTSGHVTPNIALMPKLEQLGYSVHYMGSKNGIEKQLIEKTGTPYHPINTGKLRRYFDVDNITDIFKILDGSRESISIIKQLKPDIVFSKGGFVSCPVVWAAWLCGIPVIIHESDMTPGLANKLSMPFARKICYAFPESRGHIPGEKGILTGIPIRESLLSGDKVKGMKLCGFIKTKPVITVIGGSQGSRSINTVVREALDTLLSDYQVCHICGKNNKDTDYKGIAGYKQFEYVDEDLPHLFAMTDLFISRAGATTLFEILALKKPNILIPLSRNASRGDQILNAASFEKQGFSCVVPGEKLDGESLVSSIRMVHKNRSRFTGKMEAYGKADAVGRIVRVIGQYGKQRTNS